MNEWINKAESSLPIARKSNKTGSNETQLSIDVNEIK